MTTTALIYLECSTWMKDEAHLISMASKLLGPLGKKVCWVIFVLICYASLVAYLSGGGRMVHEAISSFTSLQLSSSAAYFIYASVFGALLLCRTHTVGTVNTILFVLMVLLFVMMIQGAWKVDSSLLLRQSWDLKGLVALIPMMLCTFSIPGVVPVLSSYHKGDVSKIRYSIIGGTALTMLIYAIWLCAVLGNVPWEGENGLAAAFASDKHACDSLVHYLESPSIHALSQGFAFLALSTSFVGISLALAHFLSEGLQIKMTKFSGKLAVILIVLIPTIAIKFQFEKVFFNALDMSGGIGDGVVSGLIPALMLWQGRYVKGLSGNYRFYGNKFVLVSIMCFSVAVICYEVLKLISPFFLPT